MKLVLLVGYNNYFNRIFKKETSLSDYEAKADSYYEFSKINFVPNDNISTTQFINYTYVQGDPQPDYLLVCNEENNSIISRWFVMETVRTRGCQWKIQLRRDVLADNIDTILEAPIFVEKAILPDDDPFIYNDEGMRFNQVKKSESLLMDETKTPWIVGYMDAKKQKSVEVSLSAPKNYLTISELSTKTGIPVATLNKLFNGEQVQTMVGYWSYIYTSDIFKTPFSAHTTEQRIEGYISQDCSSEEGYSTTAKRLHRSFVGRLVSGNDYFRCDEISWKAMSNGLLSQSPSDLKSAFTSESGVNSDWITSDQYYALLSVTNVIQYNSSYYKFSIQRGEPELLFPAEKSVSANSTFASALAAASDPTRLLIGERYPDTATFRVAGRFAMLSLSKTIYTDTKIVATIGGTDRNKLRNRPYQMFCMPFYDLEVYSSTPHPSSFDSLNEAVKAIVGELEAMGDIYDIQLLPYFPFRQAIRRSRQVTTDGLEENVDFDYIVQDPEGVPEKVGIIFYPLDDSGEVYIEKKYDIDTSKKYDSNARTLRICSPNYQGSFDFNVAKNDGVEGFLAKWTYKPFTPFIRVSPDFKGLYGDEFNDQRGLICGGDFSLMRISDKWYEYQLNNKNYQNIFNREIQSLDLQQGYQMRDQKIAASAGALQGAAYGAQAGASIGGGWGAAAGAVVGSAASLVGGVVDVNTLAAMQRDQRSLAVDKFNYTLGNIRALPNTLTKVDAFDISSKKFPFVEEYAPTEKEKEAFLSKIEYESMTVMRIGRLSEFVREDEKHYFKGELIRNESLFDDYHVFQEVYAELVKGVYI